MAITLPELPYGNNALEPHISARTLEFHHGKHHNAYVTNLQKLIAGTDMEKMGLDDIIKKSAGDASKTGIFNNAAQVWNHSFYWKCMKPGGGGNPPKRLADMIKGAFGGFDKFIEEMKNAATTQFGSGWAWLVVEGGSLKIMKTSNADLPCSWSEGPAHHRCMGACYYLDIQNRRQII